jgi:transcriptional regulator with XRE-family HTH domain
MSRSNGEFLPGTLELLSLSEVDQVDFAHRLVRLRKERGLTQQNLADKVGVHLTQIFRYESGAALPTFDVLRSLAIALGVSSDELVFGKEERNPDDSLKMQFEAISQFEPDEKDVARAVLDSLILKHEARRWSSRVADSAQTSASSNAPAPSRRVRQTPRKATKGETG